jgi:hypothetical protein
MSLRHEPNGKGFLLIMYDQLKVLNNKHADAKDKFSSATYLREASMQLRETSPTTDIPLRNKSSNLTLSELFVKIQNPTDFDWRNDLIEIEQILYENFLY